MHPLNEGACLNDSLIRFAMQRQTRRQGRRRAIATMRTSRPNLFPTGSGKIPGRQPFGIAKCHLAMALLKNNGRSAPTFSRRNSFCSPVESAGLCLWFAIRDLLEQQR
jgi:hypothetical protein